MIYLFIYLFIVIFVSLQERGSLMSTSEGDVRRAYLATVATAVGLNTVWFEAIDRPYTLQSIIFIPRALEPKVQPQRAFRGGGLWSSALIHPPSEDQALQKRGRGEASMSSEERVRKAQGLNSCRGSGTNWQIFMP